MMLFWPLETVAYCLLDVMFYTTGIVEGWCIFPVRGGSGNKDQYVV